MNEPLILSPSDFIGLTNQLFEHAFPYVVIEGELADFRVSKGKWLYFKLKDEQSLVNCFGVVHMMPGPLEEGMVIRVSGTPRMHQRFGFSFNAQSISLSGEGSIKKAYELLEKKLTAEGLFEQARKRSLPYAPQKVAVVTSAEGAAIGDFTKILQERWPYIEVIIYDSLVQGTDAPEHLVRAIEKANTSDAEVLVVTRGGGGAEDLAAFNDERVVRAVAASKLPTLVAIGHEVDECLSERAADIRASTPSNAAQLLTPSRHDELNALAVNRALVIQLLQHLVERLQQANKYYQDQVLSSILSVLHGKRLHLNFVQQKLELLNPQNVLQRGYSIITSGGEVVKSSLQLKKGAKVELKFYDGVKKAEIQ